MILDKKQIIQHINDGKIKFTPELDEFQVQPTSVDLRIGWSFYVTERWQYTDAGRVAVQPDYTVKDFNKDYLKLIKLKPGQYFEVLPGELVHVSSLESIELNCGNVMAVLYPRSSMVRRGFVIQGGVVDVKYKGSLLIPIMNSTNHSLKLYAGERVYQLMFHSLNDEITDEDAARHGVEDAKYTHSTAYNLEARTDSEQEMEFIKKGDLDGLKAKFTLKKGV